MKLTKERIEKLRQTLLVTWPPDMQVSESEDLSVEFMNLCDLALSALQSQPAPSPDAEVKEALRDLANHERTGEPLRTFAPMLEASPDAEWLSRERLQFIRQHGYTTVPTEPHGATKPIPPWEHIALIDQALALLDRQEGWRPTVEVLKLATSNLIHCEKHRLGTKTVQDNLWAEAERLEALPPAPSSGGEKL